MCNNKRKIKVLFLTHYSGGGGATQALLTLIDGLKELGVEPFVIINKDKGVLQEELDNRSIEYACLPFWAGVIHEKYTKSICFPLKRVKNRILQYYMALLAIPYVKKWKIDIIHANSTLVTYGMILGRMMKIPNIWHLREAIKNQFGYVFFQSEKTMKIWAGNTSGVIAVSEYTKSQYGDILKHVDAYTIYDGTSIYAEKKEFELNDPVRITYLGGLSEAKGFDDVYQLYLGMKKRKFERYRIYIPGMSKKDAECYGNEKGWARDFFHHIVFREKMGRSQVDRFRVNMDIHFQPSYPEAFGLITAESMRIGIPIVGVNSGANIELLGKSERGLLYEKGSADDICDKIMTLILNDNLRKQIIENAKCYANNHYTAQANAKSVYNLYIKILQKSK